jgi:predicted DNA-binding transcriptional regulator AlpA
MKTAKGGARSGIDVERRPTNTVAMQQGMGPSRATHWIPARDCAEMATLLNNPQGPAVTASPDSRTTKRPLAADLADVAFLDISDVCAAVRMSASWVHDEVRAGRFPAPMRFGVRCSRWKASSVRRYLIERAEQASEEASAAMTARAKKASDAAKAKRTASASA